MHALSLNLAYDFWSLKEFLGWSFDVRDETDTNQLVKESIRFLNEKGMVENYLPTTFRDAVTYANFTVDEGLAFSDACTKIMKGLCLLDDVHLIFLCIPPETGISLPPFGRGIWERIFEKRSQAIQLITDKTAADMQRFIVRGIAGMISLGKDEQSTYEKIYAANLLAELVDECSLTKVERAFEVDRGSIQTLQSAAASYAGQGAKFTEAMGYQALSVVLLTVLKRLSFGAKGELIYLMNMPSMRRDIARMLFNGGYKSAQEVSALTTEELVAMMPHQEGGMTETDFEVVAKRIIEEADALTEHLAMLEQFEEESGWAKAT
jgi:replicative superfamily II helicase